MKRRSPWLSFAACALVGGASWAEPAAHRTAPSASLALSAAASAAEAELVKRGLAGDHFIASVSLVESANQAPHYLARIEPPVAVVEERLLSFSVAMDGRVSERRDRSSNFK